MFFVVSGPSGSGKTTLTKRLVEEFENLKFVISYTTRAIRTGEKNGYDYNFVEEEVFKRMIEMDQFAEWAFVHGKYYGTPMEDFGKSDTGGSDVLLDINIEGAMKIKSSFDNGVYIFLLPPSMEILRERLMKRNDLSRDEVELRMTEVRKEIELCSKYDYIIINDELEACYRKLSSVIRAERCRSPRVLTGISIQDYIKK